MLVGHNGAGKSTLLAILATLSRPTSGQVLYGELDHQQMDDNMRAEIGVVDHSPMLYRQLTGRENLLFFAKLYGLPQPADAVQSWLERVGMDQEAHRPVAQLSRGMIQRLALARALIHDPSVLLMDEPFTGLDREAIDLLRGELSAAREQGKVVVLTTHELGAADQLCQHLMVLKRGRLAVDIDDKPLTTACIREHYDAAR